MGGERGPVVMTSVREKQGSPHPNRLLLGRSTATYRLNLLEISYFVGTKLLCKIRFFTYLHFTF